MNFDGKQLDWPGDPLSVLSRWSLDRPVLLLHSGRYHPRWARWSVLAEPVEIYRFTGEGDPWAGLRRCLQSDDPWLGYFGYDLGRWIEQLPSQAEADRDWPVVELGRCPGYAVYDGKRQCWLACGTWAKHPPQVDWTVPTVGRFAAGNPKSVFTHDGYEAAVAQTIDYIGAGDVFQVNLSQRFTARFEGPAPAAHRAAFFSLADVSPAWYGAYLEFSDDRAHRAVASTSPELFLEMDADGSVVTRPIKGTRPANVDPTELRDSAKDAAELHMIVDLLRNDLGRVCEYGSIRVPRPRDIETHPTVHHGVSTILGQLRCDRDLVDLLRATMPGGSITGAPKVRAMQIIDELEPVRRGPYCGAIGVISPRGACLNVAIRTMLLETPRNRASAGRVDFAVGGGIVADSTPADEYEETLTKARAMFEALKLSAPGLTEG